MDVVESCDRKRCREENPQPMNNEKKKKRKKRKTQKNKGEASELPNPNNPDPKRKGKKRKNKQVQNKTESVETLLQSNQGLTLTKIPFKWPDQTSLGNSNSKSPRAPPRTHGVKVTESPVKRHADTSVICRACRQRGHRFEVCQRLKYLSRDDEICFFCGEIGHSLGKCSLSTAGGGRFAKCLFCYAQGHFSINCPQNGYRINPKVAAARGPINKTVENEGMPVAEVTNM